VVHDFFGNFYLQFKVMNTIYFFKGMSVIKTSEIFWPGIGATGRTGVTDGARSSVVAVALPEVGLPGVL